MYQKNLQLLDDIHQEKILIDNLVVEAGVKNAAIKYSYSQHFRKIWENISEMISWDLPASNISLNSPILQSPNLAFVFPPDTIEYETAYGFKLHGNVFDMWQTLATGHYLTELSETILILRLSNQIDCFLDVGANIGFYSHLLAKENSNLQIIAVEPSRTNYNTIKSSIKSNQFHKIITPLNKALGEKEGVGKLNMNIYGSGGHSMKGGKTFSINNKSELVSITTLDKLRNQYLLHDKKSLIKIDVERFENQVLQGGKVWLKSANKPIILYESWADGGKKKKDQSKVKAYKFLKSCGYHIFKINSPINHKSPVKMIKNTHINISSETGNYLAVPRNVVRDISKLINEPVDLRVLHKTEHLKSIKNFLVNSRTILENIST